MRQAMTTAAGVAGGMLAANALSSMFGGGSGSAQAGQSGQSNSPFESTTAQNDDADNMQEAQYSSHDNDPGAHDAGYDSGSDWGGDDIEV